MLSLRLRLSAASVTALLGLAVPAAAQLRGSVEAFDGYYRPFGKFEPASVYLTSLPETPSDLSSVAWGDAAVTMAAVQGQFDLLRLGLAWGRL